MTGESFQPQTRLAPTLALPTRGREGLAPTLALPTRGREVEVCLLTRQAFFIIRLRGEFHYRWLHRVIRLDATGKTGALDAFRPQII